MKNRYLFLVLLFLCPGCEKYLDQKPDKALVVPTTLADFNDLLNHSDFMNFTPGLGIVAGDEYYMPKNGLDALTNLIERNSYMWEKDLYVGTTFAPDWRDPYRQVFYANVVLEGLGKIIPSDAEKQEWNRLKGSALFFRAWAFYNLAQLFADPYDPATADHILGVPLKLQADVNSRADRGTLRQTYQQIQSDLQEAVKLLPAKTVVPTQPSKSAVYALLARIFHNIEDYGTALSYADSCLSIKNELIDYNTVNPALVRPMPRSAENQNVEVLFHATAVRYGFFSSSLIFPDSVLVKSYEENDLRKTLFFHATTGRFIGTYTGRSPLFTGLATDEVRLVRIESLARSSQKQKALDELNQLVVTRYKKGTYVPITESRPLELLELILMERRKQLFSRGVRWSDLRRLNKDPRFSKTLFRKLEMNLLSLPPNDARYLFTIPEDEILGSGIQQNNR
ncbi:RagB/SusD family nutrient uptake outer membrane protein [Dyadobacter sp. CY312]|uniref:RagB/SusD family nutrient uptake outer membrane protein n=1 Tax=Dyadobacter sp. CY312 TaxID=2907303 RepID=UPI001F22D523|nr:RagB/SusD family nutrient uptake outer membrane protein [Dyadobacter sp. CY312]MCE7044461.1 RagB/SusD family nutrient uptake outer membrane protein [Dyadobacter sp. CY312]